MVAKDMLDLNKIYLHVYSENTVAIKVYENAGFEIKDKHITSEGLEEYTMSVQL